MRYDTTPTTEARHARNNDLQLLVFKRQCPAAFARLVEELTEESRAHLFERIARMEAEEAARPC